MIPEEALKHQFLNRCQMIQEFPSQLATRIRTTLANWLRKHGEGINSDKLSKILHYLKQTEQVCRQASCLYAVEKLPHSIRSYS